MAIDYETLKNWSIPDAAQAYSERDTMLYALGLGVGADPTDAKQLAFVYEKGLKALPTLAMVIGSPGAWFTDPRIGINYTKLVNAGVSAAFHAPMPASGEVVGRSRVIALADKGVASGALLIFRRQLHERQSGLHLCDIDTTYLCRGDGGFGGPNVDAPAPHQLPETKPELTVEFRTLAQLALIYRLSGDRNPLHADPAVAVAAGFPQPILHGLCTFGVVGYVFSKLNYPLAPRVLALVLGDRAEENFRNAIKGSQGDLGIFFSNGLVGTITTLGLALMFLPVLSALWARVRAK